MAIFFLHSLLSQQGGAFQSNDWANLKLITSNNKNPLHLNIILQCVYEMTVTGVCTPFSHFPLTT